MALLTRLRKGATVIALRRARMPIKICVAGGTGWAGSAVTRRILQSADFQLVGLIARQSAGRDIGEVLGGPAAGIPIAASLEEVLPAQPDVLIDFTKPD